MTVCAVVEVRLVPTAPHQGGDHVHDLDPHLALVLG